MSKKRFSFGGFIAGLAAGAAALYLSDKKNRRKAKKVVSKSIETLEEVKDNPDKLTEVAKQSASTVKKKVRMVRKQLKQKTTTKAKSASRKKRSTK